MALYREAARFLDLSNQSGSLRSIIYSSYEDKSRNLKCNSTQVYALVSSTVNHKSVLSAVINASGLLRAERRLSEPIAMLMVHDLLFTKSGRINASKGPLKEAVLRHRTRLKAELVKYKVKHNIDKLEKITKTDVTPVRWIRVNTLKATQEEVLAELSHLKSVPTFKNIQTGCIYKDIHVPFLYGVHPSENIISTKAYKAGKIIIQDRASCFPVIMLAPSPGEKLIDACAAPGNKTTHLASFVGHSLEPSITAFERDPKRGEILKKMISTAGAGGCIDVKIQDFTRSNPDKFDDVVGMVVDPSCSGSGIFGRGFEEETLDAESEHNFARLQKLSEFQYKIVLHAMSFPNVRTIVYSTCSIHAEENERVVKRLLEDKAVQMRGWKLRPREKALPLWERRGFESELDKDAAQSCVRVNPVEDGGIGFFAACFERTDVGTDIVVRDDDEWNGFSD